MGATRHEVTVELGGRSYPVVIGPGVLGEAGARIAGVLGMRRCLFVCDSTAESIYGQRVSQGLEASGLDLVPVTVAAGEKSKSLSEVSRLAGLAATNGLGRDACVITLGGGMVADLGGFFAAVYMRGIPVVHLPTTLLAMVDAAVGGKTAVNLPDAKNLLGAFHQPSLVLADPDTLATLTQRDLVAGLAEAVKLGVALNREYYEWISANLSALLDRQPAALARLVAEACRLKAGLVAVDERDTGERELLNLGHTLGHALESATDYNRYRHGEAVAIGMLAAARLAERIGLGKEYGTAASLEELLVRAGLPTHLPPLDVATLRAAMDADKKRRGGVLRWVLPVEIGLAHAGIEVPESVLDEVLRGLGARA